MIQYFFKTILGGFYEKTSADTFTITNPIACGDYGCVLDKITTFLVYIGAPIATIMILVGGFMMVTAGGDPEKFSKGKKILLYAAIGFVVILAAGSVPKVIQSLFP